MAHRKRVFFAQHDCAKNDDELEGPNPPPLRTFSIFPLNHGDDAMKVSNWPQLILAIALCQAAGVIGSFYTVQAIPEWYAILQKPFFNPPNWIFGPVWLALYFMMALALYLIWQKGWSQNKIRLATGVFLVHLVLNALWSIIFFGMRNPSLAFAEIILLWISILVSIVMFGHIDRRAAYLLMPYGLWVSFAAILNFSLWQLNR